MISMDMSVKTNFNLSDKYLSHFFFIIIAEEAEKREVASSTI